MNDVLIACMAIAVLLPYVVYISVKLGTYAFYRGKQLFENDNKESDE